MAENKTRATEASVNACIEARAAPAQREDCAALIALLQRITGEAPKMWGPSIIGFGSYHYRYESGREGESCLVGFAIRKPDLVLYVMTEGPDQKALLARLGKHRMGKACLYFRRLADLDLAVLEPLVRGSMQAIRKQYG